MQKSLRVEGFRERVLMMSLRTVGGAVAVRQIRGTVGKVVRK